MAQLTIEQLPQNLPARTDLPSPRVAIPPAYENLAEFLHAIGDIPPQRVLLNPEVLPRLHDVPIDALGSFQHSA